MYTTSPRLRLARPGDPAARPALNTTDIPACPPWCHPDACFGDGFHASDTLGPDAAAATLYRDDSQMWLSISHGDTYLPAMTTVEARELAAAILKLVAVAGGPEASHATCQDSATHVTTPPCLPPAGHAHLHTPANDIDLTSDEVTVITETLEVAASNNRDLAARCAGHEGREDDECDTCTWRLFLAGEYDALAARIGGQR